MSKATLIAGWDDVPHLSDAAKAELSESYAPFQKRARMRGIPTLGAGAIYPIDESEFVCDPLPIPPWWRKCYALDVGWNRTAALWCAWDIESDIYYLYSEHYQAQALPAIHAKAIRARGDWIPGMCDPAARGSSQKDGVKLRRIYEEEGLNLLMADNAVEAGLLQVWQLLSSGQLKVFSSLLNWLAEFRMYRRDEHGKVVKSNDHLMDCTRYLLHNGITVHGLTEPRHAGGYKTVGQMLAGAGRS